MRSFRISPTEHTPAATARQGRYFAAEAVVGNAVGPWTGSVTTHAAKGSGGAGGADLVRTSVTATRIGPALQVLVYDDDGNLASDGLWDYQWDAENRLVRVATSAAAVAAGYPAQLWEYRYDYQGRRVMKRDALAAGSERRHLFVGWHVVAEFTWNAATSTLSLNRTFTWGLDLAGSFGATGGVGALLQIRDETQDKTLLPAYDGNGNVTALLDATTGAPAATYEYDPFGRLLRAEGSYAKDNTYRFSTKWHDDETGLVYYGHRSYSPALGRFINRDPIEEAGGLNLYAFAGNDGVNGVDVLGLNPEVTWDDDGIGWTVGVNNYTDAGDNWSYTSGRGQAALDAYLASVAQQGSTLETDPLGAPRGMAGFVMANSGGAVPLPDGTLLGSDGGYTMGLPGFEMLPAMRNSGLLRSYSITAGPMLSPKTGDVAALQWTTWNSDGSVYSIAVRDFGLFAPNSGGIDLRTPQQRAMDESYAREVAMGRGAAGQLAFGDMSSDLVRLDPFVVTADRIQTALDVAGVFDPTPFSDGFNAIIYAGRGQWGNSLISVAGIIPYAGDLAKGGKYARKVIKAGAASEAQAKAVARQVGRDLGPAARRELHDMKEGAERTLDELRAHARELYEAAGKPVPSWLK